MCIPGAWKVSASGWWNPATFMPNRKKPANSMIRPKTNLSPPDFLQPARSGQSYVTRKSLVCPRLPAIRSLTMSSTWPIMRADHGSPQQRMVRSWPILEQDIAITNLSLDLIRQARVLPVCRRPGDANQQNSSLHDAAGGTVTEDNLAYLRDVRAFRNCLPDRTTQWRLGKPSSASFSVPSNRLSTGSCSIRPMKPLAAMGRLPGSCPPPALER